MKEKGQRACLAEGVCRRVPAGWCRPTPGLGESSRRFSGELVNCKARVRLMVSVHEHGGEQLLGFCASVSRDVFRELVCCKRLQNAPCIECPRRVAPPLSSCLKLLLKWSHAYPNPYECRAFVSPKQGATAFAIGRFLKAPQPLHCHGRDTITASACRRLVEAAAAEGLAGLQPLDLLDLKRCDHGSTPTSFAIFRIGSTCACGPEVHSVLARPFS